MKTKYFKYLPLVIGFAMAFSSCSDDDSDDPAPSSTPRPVATYSVNGSADDASYDVLRGSSVIISYTARSAAGGGKDLDVISLTQSGVNATNNFTVTSSNGRDYNFSTAVPQQIANADDNNLSFTDTLTNITSQVGVTSYTFVVTDNDGLSTTSTFDINVITSTPFTSIDTGEVWHIAGLRRGSWSLTGDSSISAVTGNPDMNADIMNNNVVSTPFTGSFEVGANRANTDFVKASAMFDFSTASKEMAQAAYDAGNKITETVDPISVGDVFIFNLGDGSLSIVSVITLDPSASCGSGCANPGVMEFEYKK